MSDQRDALSILGNMLLAAFALLLFLAEINAINVENRRHCAAMRNLHADAYACQYWGWWPHYGDSRIAPPPPPR